MTINEELIDRYLSGELSGEALADFEEKLKGDEELRLEVETQKAAIAGVQQAGFELDKEEMNSWENANQSSEAPEPTVAKPAPKSNISLYLKIAAGVSVLGVASWFLFLRSPSPQELYAQFYQPLPNYVAPVERTIDNEFVGPLQKGLEHYEAGNLDLAIAVFENSLSQNPEQADMFMYLGLTYQKLGDHTTAIEHLQKSVELETQFIMAAKWHLSLSLMYCEKPGHLALLKELQSDTTSFAQKATQLLAEIED